jgi:hypothetical protein
MTIPAFPAVVKIDQFWKLIGSGAALVPSHLRTVEGRDDQV